MSRDVDFDILVATLVGVHRFASHKEIFQDVVERQAKNMMLRMSPQRDLYVMDYEHTLDRLCETQQNFGTIDRLMSLREKAKKLYKILLALDEKVSKEEFFLSKREIYENLRAWEFISKQKRALEMHKYCAVTQYQIIKYTSVLEEALSELTRKSPLRRRIIRFLNRLD